MLKKGNCLLVNNLTVDFSPWHLWSIVPMVIQDI